ncbi:hypothetical protein [Candidatus Cyanaurora vandensis]|uniref:hypothetical protein n=1 Tax=Candidatus Cyanaurora vandensis TaxID=2714958 RepID=UPI00257F4804|nr:hypothetical protein [Candidatus Cyanaurora vandensis]
MLNQKYRFACTLTFGDIYPQVMAWIGIILISVAAALASMGAANPQMAFFVVGLILVMSLPFLLFTFVTTLFNHIEVRATSEQATEDRAEFVAPPSVPFRR